MLCGGTAILSPANIKLLRFALLGRLLDCAKLLPAETNDPEARRVATLGQFHNRRAIYPWLKDAVTKAGLSWRLEFTEMDGVPLFSAIQHEIEQIRDRSKLQVLVLS